MTPTERTGGQLLAAQLAAEGVADLFAVPGVQLDWALDPLADAGIRLVVPRHEQATSYMADGYARTSGRPGVCMVVPGPGVLNATAGLATAWACSSPVLMIAGQIPSPAIGRGWGLLHEVPGQTELLRSLAKWHHRVRDAAEMPGAVHEAFARLREDAPRPVVLEVPPDVLQARAEAGVPLAPARDRRRAPSPRALAQVLARVREARTPVIVAGGGARASAAGDALLVLARRLGAPLVVTESGKGVVDERDPLVLSALGGRAALPAADLVIVAGSRFLDAQGRPPATAPGATLVYLNTDAAHGDAPRPAGLVLAADARAGAQALSDALPGPDRKAPLAGIAAIRAWCDVQLTALAPQRGWLAAIRRALPDDGVLVSEMTQVGYAAGVAFETRGPGGFVGPGFQGTLGFGFATALGAALGNPGRAVVSINGDGGFGWTMQELATAAKYRAGLVAIVFRDDAFGNVRRIQRRVFGRETGTALHNPDLLVLARAFGVRARRIDTPDALETLLRESLPADGPLLVDVPVGEMPSPWHLVHPFVPAPGPVPPVPLLPAG